MVNMREDRLLPHEGNGVQAVDEMEERVQLLADEREIGRTVLRYAHGVDRGDVEMVEACYHPGAYDDHGYASGTVEKFAEKLRESRNDQLVRHHLVGNLLIEVRGLAAVCESYFLCYLEGMDSSSDRSPVGGGLYAGRYVDRLVRRDGQWRVLRRICVMDWSRSLPAAPPGMGAQTFVHGSRGDLDPAVVAFRELSEP